jgi:hypothetical protein
MASGGVLELRVGPRGWLVLATLGRWNLAVSALASAGQIRRSSDVLWTFLGLVEREVERGLVIGVPGRPDERQHHEVLPRTPQDAPSRDDAPLRE